MRHVDRGTRVFWLLVGALAASSAFFGIGAERQRRAAQSSTIDGLESGQSVRFVDVIDGDSVMVETSGGGRMVVRLLGIKAFSPKSAKDPSSGFGRAAAQLLASTLSKGPSRVLLGDPPRDRHGRHVGKLILEGLDVGRSLVHEGLALAYLPYAFDDMEAYQMEEEQARSARRGLWAHPEVAQQADELIQLWKDEL